MAAEALMVVVVEDDVGMRVALKRILAIAGYRVETFASAEECLAPGAAANADCYVCDLQLPGDSGFALRRKLVESGSQAPVIFITGHDSPAARARAEELGATAYLPKPFEGRALVRAVEHATRDPLPG